jgi:hypothetical protein
MLYEGSGVYLDIAINRPNKLVKESVNQYSVLTIFLRRCILVEGFTERNSSTEWNTSATYEHQPCV